MAVQKRSVRGINHQSFELLTVVSKRRNSTVLLSLVMLGVFLITGGLGCKGLSSTEQAAITPFTLEYWTVFDDVDALQKLADKYRADRPYINIVVRQLRSDELYPRLVEALAEDRGPDIVSLRNRSIKGFKSKLAPMPATLSDTTVQIIKGQLSSQTVVKSSTRAAITLDQLDREYVKAVKQDAVLDGKVYGLPLSFDNLALYYNKDLLDRAGIPEPPTTWDEFQEAVKKITKYDKQTGKIVQSGAALGGSTNVPGSDDLLYVLFRQSAVSFTSSDGYAAFNALGSGYQSGADTASMSVMNFYTDFANQERDTYTWNDTLPNAFDAFSNGTLGFFFGFNYHTALLKARAPQLNFGILPMLQLNPEQPINTANYWLDTVLAKSKHQKEAWAFIDYLTHSAVTKEYLEATNRPTALRVFIPAQRDKTELNPFVSQALIAENWYRGSNYEAAVSVLNQMIKEWLLPIPDPNRVLEWRQEILNRGAARVNQTL